MNLCPYGFIWETDPHGVPALKPDLESYCIACGHCQIICPAGAVSVEGLSSPQKIDKDFSITADQARHLLKTRRSVRTFKDRQVPKETLKELLEVTRWFPTASNKQQLKWMVISSRDKIRQLADLTIEFIKKTKMGPEIIDAYQKGDDIVLRNAPHLILALGENGYFWSEAEAGIALTYLELYAHAHKLGTCWAGFFTRAASTDTSVEDVLELPENFRVCGGVMIGYPVFKHRFIPFRRQPDITWIDE